MKKIIFGILCSALLVSNSFAKNEIIKIKDDSRNAMEISQIKKWDLPTGGTQNVCLLYDKYDPDYSGVFYVALDKNAEGPILLSVQGSDKSGCNNKTLNPGEAVTCHVYLDHTYGMCVIWNSPKKDNVHGTYHYGYVE